VISISEKQRSIIEFMDGNVPHPRSQDQSSGQLEELKKTCLGCNLCQLRGGCAQVVFGDGNSRASLMLVGEAPGADEDRSGTPFVGRAGQLLDRILTAAAIDRKKIFITNVVKCRPPGNRLPLQPEVEACLPYLKKQIELINPQIIVCLGALASKTLINKSVAITRDRGKWHNIDGRRVIATFHPAALLRDPSRKKDVWEDFKQVMKYYSQ
jgi:uracil-DNA glycosylase